MEGASPCGSLPALPHTPKAPIRAFPTAWPRPCPRLGSASHLPSLWVFLGCTPVAWALPRPGCPTRHSHCLESGVTFSMSSMKFFRNSVLLSEAFRSLQYSLGVGRGKKSGLGGLDRAVGLRLPHSLPGHWLRSPGLSRGCCIPTGYSHYMPGRLPCLSRGRADTRGMVRFLQPGRFSRLAIGPLCSWTQMARLGGPRKGLMAGLPTWMLCSCGHKVGEEVPALASTA